MVLREPAPKVLILEINWTNKNIEFVDLLKIYVSIKEKFVVNDIYRTELTDVYRIKAVCCFVGAHYFSFVRFDYSSTESYWRLFNDTEIKTYHNWAEVLHRMMDTQVLPTLLFYEKCDSESMQN